MACDRDEHVGRRRPTVSNWLNGPIGEAMNDGKEWRAGSRYWKGCGLFLHGSALAVPYLSGADDPVDTALAMLVVVSPLVLWMWRVAAWEEPGGLAIRNFFRAKVIPWDAIEKLELSETFCSTDWIYGAVRHDRGSTHIKALVAVRIFGSDRMIADLRDLASRRDLPLDETSIADHAL